MGDLRLPPPPENGESSDILISKRLRRPSVRLGEIGGSKFSKINSPSSSKPSTKARGTTTATRRVRTNWPSLLDDAFEASAELKSSGGDDSGDDDFVEDSARVRVSDGVRSWLDGIGLGRYASVYEIHEVDDEVLPMLTLEDLKDMGIDAVGSRRKMYCAIQKLRKSRDL